MPINKLPAALDPRSIKEMRAASLARTAPPVQSPIAAPAPQAIIAPAGSKAVTSDPATWPAAAPKFINPSDLSPDQMKWLQDAAEKVFERVAREKAEEAATRASAMPALPGEGAPASPTPPLPFTDWSVPQPTAAERAAVQAAFQALAAATKSLADLILLVNAHPEFWLSWAKAAKAGTMTFNG